MPLNDHEQRILEEIERRLAEDDPRLDEQVGRTDLYTHLARRVRRAAVGFVAGFVVMVVTFFAGSLLLAAVAFVAMVLCALLLYRYVGRLGRDQLRAMQDAGGGTLGGLIGRIVARLRRPPSD